MHLLLALCLVTLSSLRSSKEVNSVQFVDSLTELAWNTKSSDPTQSIALSKKALRIASSIGYSKGIADAHARLAVVYKSLENYNLARRHYFESYRGRKAMEDSAQIANAFSNLGIFYRHIGQYDSSIIYLDSCIQIRIDSDDSLGLIKAYDNIAAVYQFIEDYPTAFLFYSKEQVLLETGIVKKCGRYWNNIANFHYLTDSKDLAITFYQKAAKAYEEENQVLNHARSLHQIAVCYSELDSHSKAVIPLQRAWQLASQTDDSSFLTEMLLNRLHIHSITNSLSITESEALGLSNSIRFLGNAYKKMQAHQLLYQRFKATEPILAIHHLERYQTLKDSIIDKERIKTSIQFEKRFKVGEAKRNALKAQNEKKQIEVKNRKLLIIAISLSALFIISILIIILFRQRLKSKNQLAAKNEELHQQRLDELMKEKQLERLTALMEGQEQERARIAADLHDGVGSLLSTVKHHFQVVEGKMDKGAEQMDKAQNLLDEACDEVRRISHDMASNVLSKFGLVAALQDLAESISASEKLKLELITTDIEKRLENSTEIHLFRIVQELIGNALKHAKASKASIQLTRHHNELNLIVEDDGIGFNPEDADTSSGIGLENLRARVKHLNGHISFDSTYGKGTTVVVDIPVTS